MKPRYSIPLVLVGLLILGVFFLTKHPAEAPSMINEESKTAKFSFSPIEHASFVMSLAGIDIFNDPVGDYTDYTSFSAPDIILLSDIHGDHLNPELVESLMGPTTVVVAPQVVFDELSESVRSKTTVLRNDESSVVKGVSITAVPMYNLPESEDVFHAKGRGNGYLLEMYDKRIYIAGDTAGTPEMRAMKDIDYAFVPMNLPYTMTVEEAADAVLEFAPQNVYPYHYRGTEGLSDVAKFKELVNASNTDIAVGLVDWYPSQDKEIDE